MVYADTKTGVKPFESDDTIDNVTPIVNGLIGVLLFIYALVKLAECILETEDSVYMFAAAFVVMACGLAAQTVFRHDTLKTIAMYALALGLSRIIVSAEAVMDNGVFAAILDIFLILLGLNLTISGISYFLGSSRRRSNMMMTTSLLFILNIFVICILINDLDLIEYANDVSSLISITDRSVICLLYLIFIWRLDSEEARYNSTVGKRLRALKGIRDEFCIDNNSWVFEPVVDNLIQRTGPLWSTPDDGGPVESEMLFKIRSMRNKNYVLVQKWKDDDRLYFSVRNGFQGTVLSANRFAVDSVSVEDGRLHLISKEGVDIWLNVENKEVHYEY